MRHISKNINLDYSIVVPREFYYGVRYILYLNRFIGFFPISVIGDKDSYVLKWSWLRAGIANVCVLLFGILIITGLILSYSIEEVYNIRIKGTTTLLITLSEVVTLLFIWLFGQTYTSIYFVEFWKYFSHLLKCDEIMGPLQDGKKSYIIILVVFIFTLSCLGMDIYMWARITVPLVGITSFVWKMVPWYFTYIFASILQINFWMGIHGTSARIEKLGKLITDYIKLERRLESSNVSNGYNSYCGRRRKMIRIANAEWKSLGQRKRLTTAMVKEFIYVYQNLADANDSLNSVLGTSMTMILFSITVSLIITPCVLYQQIRNVDEDGFIYTQSYWMLCHFLRVLLLIQPCHAQQTQGKQIKKSVVKMLCLDLMEDVHKQVKILQLLVSETTIEWNASGITLINRSLLPAIGGAVFTYLAILYQYI